MRWFATAQILTLSVVYGVAATADDGLPLLAPPSGHPATTEASAAPNAPAAIPEPTKPSSSAKPDNRPVLALPGITVPSSRSPRSMPRPTDTTQLPPPSLAPSADGGLPPLEMPGRNETSAPVGSRSSLGTTLLPLPSERFRPPIVDSTPKDDPLFSDELPPMRPPVGTRVPLPTSPGIGSARRDSFRVDPLEDLERGDPKDKLKEKPGRAETLPPPRRPGVFGGRFNLFAPPRGGVDASESSIKAEPRTDPAADAELKRRVERQARSAVGDRVKDLDVRVIGRSVTIQARGVKFLQKRAVRRTLESLPGLSGYRSSVDVLD